MKRMALKQVALVVGKELGRSGYDYWHDMPMVEPLVFTRDVEGQVINIEVQKLESTSSYVHLGISVDDGGFLSSRFPPGVSIIVEKKTS